jgi:hypothetical protein
MSLKHASMTYLVIRPDGRVHMRYLQYAPSERVLIFVFIGGEVAYIFIYCKGYSTSTEDKEDLCVVRKQPTRGFSGIYQLILFFSPHDSKLTCYSFNPI